MNILDTVGKLQALVFSCELPRTDMTLYGIKCPYCGKSDRIQQLERPQGLTRTMASQELTAYADLWQQLVGSDGAAGICKFCQNLLKLVDGQLAEPFYK